MTQLGMTIPLFLFSLLLIELLIRPLIIKPAIMMYARSNGKNVWVKVGFSWPAFFFHGLWAWQKGLENIGAIVTILELGLVYIIISNEIPTAWLSPLMLLGVFFGWNGNTWWKNQLERNGYEMVRSTPSEWRFFKESLSDQTRFNRISSLCFAISLALFIQTAYVYFYLSGESHDVSWLSKISWEPLVISTLVPALAILPKAFLSPTLLTSLAVAMGGYIGGYYLSLTYMDKIASPFIAIAAVVLLFVGFVPFKRWLSSNKRVKNDA